MSNFCASAYVQAQRLCVLGIYESPWGPIPFSHAEQCETDDGPIDVGTEQPETVTAAIDKSEKAIMANVEREKIRLAAEDLVDRTNHGDQNAAGLMIVVKQNALKGNPRAKMTMHYMVKYAKKVQGGGTFNGDTVSPGTPRKKMNAKVIRVLQNELGSDASPVQFRSAVMTMLPSLTMLEGSVTLSNGPDLDKTRIECVVDMLPDTDKQQFIHGFKDWRNTSIKTDDVNYKLGRIFGLARTIQLVRQPQTPISTLSKAAGLELD